VRYVAQGEGLDIELGIKGKRGIKGNRWQPEPRF
jgi:hypothetical protein